MIVSHRHRFIFFAVPRTATHAVRAALAGLLGAEDWRQQGLTERVALPIPALARLGHGHITLCQACAYLPDAVTRDYFKFAFVRNPYDRFVSACAMLNSRNPSYAGNERAFMKRALAVSRFRQRVLIRPQVDMLVAGTGEIGMDYVGRYETLQCSFDDVCDRVGVARQVLDRRNTTEHARYDAILDAELLGDLNELYGDDFARFGYPLALKPTNLPDDTSAVS